MMFFGVQLCNSQNTISKDTIPFLRFNNLSTKFSKPSIELNKGEIISNVLKVVNHDNFVVKFTVDAILPYKWTKLYDSKKKYKIKPKDTLIIPIIILPPKRFSDFTEIDINTNIWSLDGNQIGNNFFTIKTKKKIDWSINLNSNSNLYFKNNEQQKEFSFYVKNNGNYKQDLFLNYITSKEDLILVDSLLKPIKSSSTTFSLLPNEEKEFSSTVFVSSIHERNKKRISINNFSPDKNNQKIVRSLAVHTSEPFINNSKAVKKSKINFIKLPNQTVASTNRFENLPLILDLTAQNILDDRSFLSLNLYGFKQLNSRANLVYNTQLNYSNSYLTNNLFNNTPWYVGYFDNKKSIEIGQVNSNIIGLNSMGKGLKVAYRFNDQHSVGAFYTNSLGLFSNEKDKIISYGGWYQLNYRDKVSLKANIGRNHNSFTNRLNSVATLQPAIKMFKSLRISLLGGVNITQSENDVDFQSNNGYVFGTNFSTNLFKNKLNSTTSVRYNDRYFSNGSLERVFINQRLRYNLSKVWMAMFSGNYQNNKVFNRNTDLFLFNQENIVSNLSFTKKTSKGSYQPGLFYEYRNFPNNSFVFRGFNFRYSFYNIKNNLLTSILTRAGYAKSNDIVDSKDDFSFEMNGFFRYRTYSISGRYNFGSFSSITSQQQQNNYKAPQSFRGSLQHQYLFDNRQFVLESNLIYSYNNIFSNHSIGISPQLFYFTDTGWRFGLSSNYMLTSSDFSSVYDIPDYGQNLNQTSYGAITSSDLNINFSLKKEFGIPIPFVKKATGDAKFVSFLDVNGNGIKDEDEVSVQNVVINVDDNEVITNIDGEAIVKNLKLKSQKIELLPLEDMNGWFPNINDSLQVESDKINYIPFVRGVKIYGDVIVDQQFISKVDKSPLDLSRIKISAIQGEKIFSSLTDNKGHFEFYLPFGEYTLTLDERILSGTYRLIRNNIKLTLKNKQVGKYVSFYILEKRRKVIMKDFTKKKNN